MTTNKFKKDIEAEKRGSLFALLDKYLRLESVFEHGLPIKFLPYILYLFAIVLFYIGNNHWVEKNIREINKLETLIEDLRADYTTLTADYMFSSKQSEVAAKVKSMNIYESFVPPQKIIIKNE